MLMGYHEDTVMVRSTTDSYGRSLLEAVYEERIIHSTEAIWQILARKEWLGCWHDTSPMVDILGSTLVWTQYMLFFDFKIWKVLCIMFWKFIVLWKKQWWFLTLSWPDDVQRTFSTTHDVFNLKWKSINLILF